MLVFKCTFTYAWKQKFKGVCIRELFFTFG